MVAAFLVVVFLVASPVVLVSAIFESDFLVLSILPAGSSGLLGAVIILPAGAAAFLVLSILPAGAAALLGGGGLLGGGLLVVHLLVGRGLILGNGTKIVRAPNNTAVSSFFI